MAAISYTINRLSPDFFKDYNPIDFPEIENKQNRPYMVLVIKIENNTFALPLRTNIRHNYGYKFKNSNRETESSSGIDYTKAVIVNNQKYIGEETFINSSEYIEIDRYKNSIVSGFKRYLDGYINFWKNGGNSYSAKRYQYSTLQYFHAELGLE